MTSAALLRFRAKLSPGCAADLDRFVAAYGDDVVLAALSLDKYAGKSLREFREEIESEFIRMKLAELNWNISKTAQVLGIERTNLHKKLRALGIHRGEDGKDE